MRLPSVILLGLCWPALVLAADPLVGQKVFLKESAVVMAGDRVIDEAFLVTPAQVSEVNGDRVIFDRVVGQVPLWAERKYVLSPDEAVAYFNEQVEQDPNSAAMRTKRGTMWLAQDQIEKAIADLSEATRIDPNFLEAHRRLASAYYSRGEYENALREDVDVIRLAPKVWLGYNEIAWIRATCPDEQFRDGALAVKNATTACEVSGWKNGGVIDTLAAAYAEKGEFDSAVEWEEKAVAMSSGEDAKACRQRLDLYKSGKPYREDPRALKAADKPAAE